MQTLPRPQDGKGKQAQVITMSMDTYKLRVMHCPLCEHQASHRAVSAFPATSCPKCKGTTLGQYVDGVTHLDLLATEHTSVSIRT